ncbi:toxin glutamine deamidase domain-containing protein [Amycolatopsis sp. EV170708-02-1]|uniref:toxin glutamine deamidase domain-containing protein n=1 Tax=Amycolatopsis sp. EV170708-02-1 TaxID=2919322 RepID=UPI001F0C88AD|nr:toxin glutamine deamidase domain-containing protein [Amycolatopsis sp. EV170708-02-1]UMP06972.1 toxin glutamine deamidase domain-containing protein [Amycolatopsis sp. EV170708-02-1]
MAEEHSEFRRRVPARDADAGIFRGRFADTENPGLVPGELSGAALQMVEAVERGQTSFDVLVTLRGESSEPTPSNMRMLEALGQGLAQAVSALLAARRSPVRMGSLGLTVAHDIALATEEHPLGEWSMQIMPDSEAPERGGGDQGASSENLVPEAPTDENMGLSDVDMVSGPGEDGPAVVLEVPTIVTPGESRTQPTASPAPEAIGLDYQVQEQLKAEKEAFLALDGAAGGSVVVLGAFRGNETFAADVTAVDDSNAATSPRPPDHAAAEADFFEVAPPGVSLAGPAQLIDSRGEGMVDHDEAWDLEYDSGVDTEEPGAEALGFGQLAHGGLNDDEGYPPTLRGGMPQGEDLWVSSVQQGPVVRVVSYSSFLTVEGAVDFMRAHFPLILQVNSAAYHYYAYRMNCAAAAIATYNTIVQGRVFIAGPEDWGREQSDLERAFRLRFRRLRDFDSVARHMLSLSTEAHGVLQFQATGGRNSHIVNVHRSHDGIVTFLDGQTGLPAKLPADVELVFLMMVPLPGPGAKPISFLDDDAIDEVNAAAEAAEDGE